MSRLPFGPLDDGALVVCVDMQRIFLEPGDWFCPAGLEILPAIRSLVAARPERSWFTRFITAKTPEAATGTWQRYYRHWTGVTQEAAGADVLDLHGDLAPYAGPGRVFDKWTHDAFDSDGFAAAVAGRQPSALVFCGVETDVCILASVLSAVDLGYRVVIPRDAVASSDRAGHRACLDAVYPRFDQQVELVSLDDILAEWTTP